MHWGTFGCRKAPAAAGLPQNILSRPERFFVIWRFISMRRPARLFHPVMVLCLSTAGCSLSDMIAGDRVRSDGDTVSIGAASALDAMPFAVGHCHHSSKSAEYVGPAGAGRYRYRCV
jgi:hypothetical protein